VDAYTGESVAAALTAAGIVALHEAADGTPRGVFCGMGVCSECLVRVNGGGIYRACMLPVREGMAVNRGGARCLPIECGAPEDNLEPCMQNPVRQPDVLIVGGGPAGLSAAKAAASAGAEVVLLDERSHLGGQYFKQILSHRVMANEADRQARKGANLISDVKALGVRVLTGAVIWGAFDDKRIAAVIGRKSVVFKPSQLILATGAYERGVPMPGWTLPGYMTAGAAQTLLRSYRVIAGERILIAGNGPLNLQLAAELLKAGANVVALVDSSRKPGLRSVSDLLGLFNEPDLVCEGLRYMAVLRNHGTPVLHEHAVISAYGRQRVESAKIARLDPSGRPAPGSERSLDVDTVCVGYGFLPSNELARSLGCNHRFDDASRTLKAIVDEDGMSSVPGVFIVGDGAGMSGARAAEQQGKIAGWAATRNLGRPLQLRKAVKLRSTRRRLARHYRFQDALWSIYAAPALNVELADDNTMICRCENVTLNAIHRALSGDAMTVGTIKRLTRAGMGRCQGRYCGPVLSQLVGHLKGVRSAEKTFFAPRPPARPIDAGKLARIRPNDESSVLQAPVIQSPRPETQLPGKILGEADTLVVGGGIVGCCAAYFLAERGVSVMLIERDDINMHGSGTNAGSLHVQISSSYAKLADPHVSAAIDAALPLHLAAIGEWKKISENMDVDIELDVQGGLMVAGTEAEAEFLQIKSRRENRNGVATSIISGSELKSLAPYLSGRIVAACYCPDEGKVNPAIATFAVARAAERSGASLLRNVGLLRLRRVADGFVAETRQGAFRCRRVIDAAGPWADDVAAMIGLALPVDRYPLQMCVTEPVHNFLPHLLQHAGIRLTMKQAKRGNVIVGGGWPAQHSLETDRITAVQGSIEGSLWAATQVVPGTASLEVYRTWGGMIHRVPDRSPVLGSTKACPGFYMAAPVPNGYTLGPISALMVVNQMSGVRHPLLIDGFSPDRFQLRV
jgi:D-hydroxyproline dehydrogenase subunit alpha